MGSFFLFVCLLFSDVGDGAFGWLFSGRSGCRLGVVFGAGIGGDWGIVRG